MALNPQNLVPNSERTPEERRRNAQKAGLASGRRRRQNKNLRDAFLAVQDLLLPKKGGGEETASDAIAFALVRKAVAGDLRAIQLLWECNYGKNAQTEDAGAVGIPRVKIDIEMPNSAGSVSAAVEPEASCGG